MHDEKENTGFIDKLNCKPHVIKYEQKNYPYYQFIKFRIFLVSSKSKIFDTDKHHIGKNGLKSVGIRQIGHEYQKKNQATKHLNNQNHCKMAGIDESDCFFTFKIEKIYQSQMKDQT